MSEENPPAASAAMEAKPNVIADFPKYIRLAPFQEPEPPKKVQKIPRVIDTLIPSRQTPKLRLRDVRRVIRGRSKPIVRIFMESY